MSDGRLTQLEHVVGDLRVAVAEQRTWAASRQREIERLAHLPDTLARIESRLESVAVRLADVEDAIDRSSGDPPPPPPPALPSPPSAWDGPQTGITAVRDHDGPGVAHRIIERLADRLGTVPGVLSLGAAVGLATGAPGALEAAMYAAGLTPPDTVVEVVDPDAATRLTDPGPPAERLDDTAPPGVPTPTPEPMP